MKNFYNKLTVFFTMCMVSLILAAPAIAAPTIDDIYTAADLSGIQGKLIAFFLLLVGGCLAIAAYRVSKKVISRMGSLG